MLEVANLQEVKSGELVSKKVGDLLGRLEQIEESLKSTSELIESAGKMEDRGRFKAIFSGISGKSDKELARIVKGLGANVKVTQEIVKFLIELAQHKNEIQEGFLGALDEKIEQQHRKIELLGENDDSLGENYKQAETAVLTLYKQIHAQVESEVELRKNVGRNMENISTLFDAINSKGQTDEEQSEQISQLIKAMQQKAVKMEEIRLALEAKEVHLDQVADNVEKQSKKLESLEMGLEEKALKLEQTIGDIQENTTADKSREKRIFKLEAELKELSQRKPPQLPTYVAITLAIFALVTSLFSVLTPV